MQQVINNYIKNLKTFLNYTKSYLRRNNPLKMIKNGLVAGLRDAFSINKKKKMITVKLKYQMHRLNQMEKLIAQNNEHAFLKGKKINEMR